MRAAPNHGARHHDGPRLRPIPTPVPVRRRGRRPPLEARRDWDPWLPPHEAAPDLPPVLHGLVFLVLSLVTVFLGLLLAALARP